MATSFVEAGIISDGLRDEILAERLKEAEALVKDIDLSQDIEIKLLTGTPFIEVIQEVIRGKIRSAGQTGRRCRTTRQAARQQRHAHPAKVSLSRVDRQADTQTHAQENYRGGGSKSNANQCGTEPVNHRACSVDGGTPQRGTARCGRVGFAGSETLATAPVQDRTGHAAQGHEKGDQAGA